MVLGNFLTCYSRLLSTLQYTIISVRPKVCGKYDFIMLRNPHGCGEWTGRWADGSAEWKAHPEVKAELDYEEINDDGAFWMLKEDLFRWEWHYFLDFAE